MRRVQNIKLLLELEVDMKHNIAETLKYEEGRLYLLDQTLLPNEESYFPVDTLQEAYDAIKHLKVRGAPAIGVAAALSIAVLAKKIESKTFGEFMTELNAICDKLITARPTAVNLSWAVERMRKLAENSASESCNWVKMQGMTMMMLEMEAKAIWREDQKACLQMGMNGLKLLKSGMNLLTHCNAGALATAGIGTALSPIYAGLSEDYNFFVYVDETRPVLQGARLTAYEMKKADIPHALICDNMAASLFAAGKVDAVLVGCDRMAMNGDGANKIGTLALAVLAKHYDIPFYMFVPTSTIDPQIESGDDIKIEMRDGEEIGHGYYAEEFASADRCSYNPAFDVTPAELITAVVTEKGVVKPPYKENLSKIIG